MISFARNEQIGIAAEYASSFALDNGAFSLWRAGQRRPAWDRYYRWIEAWRNHPGFDFAIIPDVIDGSEEENDDLLAEWPFFDGAPVYHLHEPLDRLLRLANSFSRIALGSSGPYRCTCVLRWWDRMQQIMTMLCSEDDVPDRQAAWTADIGARDNRAHPTIVGRFGDGGAERKSRLEVERNLWTAHKSRAGHHSAGPHCHHAAACVERCGYFNNTGRPWDALDVRPHDNPSSRPEASRGLLEEP